MIESEVLKDFQKLSLLLEQKDKRIAELKQQLATKENTITNLIEDNRASQEWYKKQLAEKDEKIEKLKSENHALMSDNAYQEADIFELNSFKEYHKNNKISFAVEQLEKVKEFCDGIKLSMIYISQEDTTKIQTIIEEIDNQIKAIKGREV